MSSYSIKDLQSIADQFLHVGEVKDFHKFTSGTDNSNFYIKTESGEWVIRIYDGMNLSREAISLELEVMHKASTAGVKTPRVFSNKSGSFAVPFGQTFAMCMEYIDGQNMKKQEVSDQIVFQAGVEVGKMDKSLSSFAEDSVTRPDYIFDLKNFLKNEKNIDLLPKEYNQQIFRDIVEEYKKKEKQIWSLPKGIIHNDITLHNLLVKNGELKAIIDFSDIAFNPYIQNIAVAMSQLIFTYNWQPHQAGIFIKGYGGSRRLTGEELDLLYLITLTRYTTLVVEFNRWGVENGDESVNDFVVDNYNFLTRFKEIGKMEFDALIRKGIPT